MTTCENQFDTLRMYFGEKYWLNEKISISQPTIGDILEMGEKDFFSSLYVFIGNPTTFRLQLWNIGVDWNKIKDFELFCTLVLNVDKKFTDLIFTDIDFGEFKLCERK